MRRIAQSMTLLRQRAGGNELPDVEAGSPRLRGPLQSRRDIVVRGADFFHLLGNGQRLFSARIGSDDTPTEP